MERMLNSVRSSLAIVILFATASPAQQPASSAPASRAPASGPEAAASTASPTDPREIVRRSVEVDHHNWELARSYTCRQHEVEKDLDRHGQARSTKTRTYDVNFYYGELYSRLIQKDDQPLNEADQKKEDEKLEKFLAKLRNQSEEERDRRLSKEKKEHEEERLFLRDMVNAYDFTLVGSETVNGTDAWVIDAAPRKDFRPTQPHADMLSKIKGRIWIEKKDYNWVKVEAESIDTISFGLFLFRIHKGAHFSLDQVHLNDEVWLFHRIYVNGSARLALFKNLAVEQEDEFTNYKRFSATTRILPGVHEVPSDSPKQ
ncbi:MAG TPA: hypothetical protein VKW06_19630 [Candidatus Angelobacter sp.]|nr:hypothetical protein [Candidatus Angelobacter sp.]